ncbi:Hypothetical protein A7982_11193 [Minicystis rosea]|nr:Hypothetical protein A7982_11193 [Minicystis rosea]
MEKVRGRSSSGARWRASPRRGADGESRDVGRATRRLRRKGASALRPAILPAISGG